MKQGKSVIYEPRSVKKNVDTFLFTCKLFGGVRNNMNLTVMLRFLRSDCAKDCNSDLACSQS